MGTRGYIVYKCHNRYCCKFNQWDSYPDGLGVELLAQIPTDPAECQKWRREKRSFCVRMFTLHDTGKTEELEEWEVRKDIGELYSIWYEWVYEIDLDAHVFKVNFGLMYRLSNMPPKDIFLRCISHDFYGYPGPAQDTPPQYLPNPEPGFPPYPFPDDQLDAFARLHNEAGPSALHDLISRPQSMTHRETTCARVLSLFIGQILLEPSWNSFLALQSWYAGTDDMPIQDKWFLYAFSRIATCPLYYHPTAWEKKYVCDGIAFETTSKVPPGDYWWLRKHICVRPVSSHLHQDKHFQGSLGGLANEIMSANDVPNIVYGVAFSLSHIVIIRVDRSNGGTFKYTKTMQFLPSRYPTTPLTEGMSALIRIGDLRGQDDVDFFHRNMPSAMCGPLRYDDSDDDDDDVPKVKPVEVVERANVKIMPIDILMRIADYIDQPRTLNAFAVSSTAPMTAALRWLKFPQVEVPHLRIRDKLYLHSIQHGPMLIHACSFLEPDEPEPEHRSQLYILHKQRSEQWHLWSGRYRTMVRGKEVVFRTITPEPLTSLSLPFTLHPWKSQYVEE
ncbi:hypothetical protein EIP91_011975 [Steccherinum ochraceum]|uniref:Uncharacterized protein n=1 Tax=Steccherinum ochraceum TaxID=92696 RepID=A0A4R0RLA2_9APHY|nr:hypothetical protein EIP91_011975 [Steccherinum ochraceum]